MVKTEFVCSWIYTHSVRVFITFGEQIHSLRVVSENCEHFIQLIYFLYFGVKDFPVDK